MKRSNNMIIIVIAIIIAGGCFFYSWKYILPDYKKNQQKLATTTAEIKNAKTKLESLKTAQTTLSDLGDLVSQMSIAVPVDKDTPNLITELEAVTAKYQIALPTVQISDSTAGSANAGATSSSSIGAVNVSFSVNGSFDNIQKLIYDLEHDIRFMNVQSISLTSAGTAKSGGQMSMSLQLTAYKRANTSLSSGTAAAGATSTATTP